MILWTDKRDVGFQGTGVDQRIEEATWDSSSFTWYWDDLGLIIPESGLRIFVSVETEKNMEDKEVIQLEGHKEPVSVIKFCRLCELSCPIGKDKIFHP